MLRIDANVEETQAQVELGHTELLKYFKVMYCFSINGISKLGSTSIPPADIILILSELHL